jgi:hypothetical protein
MLAPVLIAPLAVRVVPQAAMQRPPTAATSPQKPLVLMPRKPPLSASAKSPRQLQQLTAHPENKHAATRT